MAFISSGLTWMEVDLCQSWASWGKCSCIGSDWEGLFKAGPTQKAVEVDITCQPGVDAQTLFPSELKMAALSTSPEPTRLHKEEGQSLVSVARPLIEFQKMKAYLWST